MSGHNRYAPMGAPKPYKRPQLRTYGAITNLVQGSSGIAVDGFGGRLPMFVMM